MMSYIREIAFDAQMLWTKQNLVSRRRHSSLKDDLRSETGSQRYGTQETGQEYIPKRD